MNIIRSVIHRLLVVGFLCQPWPIAAQNPGGQAPIKIKQRADGTRYIAHEVKVCVTEEFAKRLSFKNSVRAAADTAGITVLHAGIQGVRGGHSSAEAWLEGRPFPKRLQVAEGSIPESARCITLLLRDGINAEAVVAALRQNPNIVWAELSTLSKTDAVPNDPVYPNQWAPARMGLEEAWDIPQRSTNIRIAIVDTGVDLEHPDLRITFDKGFSGNSSGDAKDSSPDPAGDSSRSHGTHVAGIAAAIRNNMLGVAGVADAEIMAMGCAVWVETETVKAWFIGSATDAIRDAVDNGADIVNCSFECPRVGGIGADQNDMSAAMRSAVDHAKANNALVVAAAGNDGADISNTLWTSHEWVIVVTNSTNVDNDPLTASSSFGEGVDLAAPGTFIRSTLVFTGDMDDTNDYGYKSGTSMAAPQVAGGAARVWGLNPDLLSAKAVKHILARMARLYADRGPTGVDDQYGAGRLSFSRGFHSPIREATAFVAPDSRFSLGTYSFPHQGLALAFNAIADGGTLVLNGGTEDGSDFTYTATLIEKKCILTALPDKSVVIQHP